MIVTDKGTSKPKSTKHGRFAAISAYLRGQISYSSLVEIEKNASPPTPAKKSGPRRSA